MSVAQCRAADGGWKKGEMSCQVRWGGLPWLPGCLFVGFVGMFCLEQMGDGRAQTVGLLSAPGQPPLAVNEYHMGNAMQCHGIVFACLAAPVAPVKEVHAAEFVFPYVITGFGGLVVQRDREPGQLWEVLLQSQQCGCLLVAVAAPRGPEEQYVCRVIDAVEPLLRVLSLCEEEWQTHEWHVGTGREAAVGHGPSLLCAQGGVVSLLCRGLYPSAART